MASFDMVTPENIATVLANDGKVKVAGIDGDGVLRGKIIAKSKFLSSVTSGFGMSSAIFGWDMHDVLYADAGESGVTSAETGFADFIAIPDLASFRRIPWENDIAFFLLRFEVNNKPVSVCGRSLLKGVCEEIAKSGYQANAGGMSAIAA
jgi:glutamine synthetase